MLDPIDRALKRLRRDRDLPLHVLMAKGAEFAMGLATAQLWLRTVDAVGVGVRTIGRPHIVNRGRMEVGDGVILRSTLVPVELTTDVGARLSIGANTFLNYGVSIGAIGSIQVGARVNVGPYAMIIDTEFHDPYQRSLVPPPRPVVIEDDVFLGAKCSVLPGVHVGRAAIVGAGCVVTRDVEAFSVVAGVPARVINRLDPARFRG